MKVSSSNPAESKHFAESFPPIIESDARLLIIGSMPGRLSLQADQYYAHPQNSFWPIIENLFGVLTPLGYSDRTQLLTQNKIALWDVLRTCIRPGSLDSSIKADSIRPNDFETLYNGAPNIEAVFFNGATAEREYKKRVIPALPEKFAKLPCYRLPSTSPAMASLSRNDKLERWRLVTETLQGFV